MANLTENWINYFRISSLENGNVEKLFSFLGEYTPGHLFTRNRITAIFENTEVDSNELFKSLIESKILDVDQRACPICHEKFDVDFTEHLITCSNCASEINIGELPLLRLLDNGKNSGLKSSAAHYRNSAQLVIKNAMEKGYVYYLKTDIESSTALQSDADPDLYNSLHGKLISNIWPRVYRVCEKGYLTVFSQGDAVYIILLSLEDAINSILTLGNLLHEIPKIKVSAFLGKIHIKGNIVEKFKTNILGTWDFNDYSVTYFHRITDGLAKKDIWHKLEQENNYRIKFAFVDELTDEVNSYINSWSTSEKKHPVCTTVLDEEFPDKHEINYKSKYIACVY